MKNSPDKIEYLRRVREKCIDPMTSHPYYRTFLRFLEKNETDPHYPRFAQTMAEMLNRVGDLIENRKDISICETGGLSLISRFFIEEGYSVNRTETKFDDIVLFNESGAKKYVEEVWRVLKPDGVVVLTTPNPASLKALIQVIEYEPPMMFRPHVREYTKTEIVELFGNFDLIDYRTFFAWFFIENGPDLVKGFEQKLGWNPADRGDDHFFIFRKGSENLDRRHA
jgi:SAM-dependent methyltransferase